jgi:hypothetical protein
MFFCSSAECSFPAAKAPRHHRQRPSVRVNLAIFTLLLCSSAECSSSDAAESCRIAAGSGLGTGLSTAGNGLGTTAKYLRSKKNGAAGNRLAATIKYLRGLILLVIHKIHFSIRSLLLQPLKIILLHKKKAD